MELKDFDELMDKYNFIGKIPNFDNCLSKIFFLEDKESKIRYACKRILKSQYRKEEWSNPNEIDTDRVVRIKNVYVREYLNSIYYYLVMSYNGKIDLFDMICYGNFKERELKPIVREMALCIKDCHDKGIVHLDIKTENYIVLSKTPFKCCLIDFGYSRKLNECNKINTVVGTLKYYAPELDKGYVSLASDIWSFACIIYFIAVPGGGSLQYRDYINWDKKFRGYGFSNDFQELIKSMAKINPESRITIDQVLESNWLKEKE